MSLFGCVNSRRQLPPTPPSDEDDDIPDYDAPSVPVRVVQDSQGVNGESGNGKEIT